MGVSSLVVARRRGSLESIVVKRDVVRWRSKEALENLQQRSREPINGRLSLAQLTVLDPPHFCRTDRDPLTSSSQLLALNAALFSTSRLVRRGDLKEKGDVNVNNCWQDID